MSAGVGVGCLHLDLHPAADAVVAVVGVVEAVAVVTHRGARPVHAPARTEIKTLFTSLFSDPQWGCP